MFENYKFSRSFEKNKEKENAYDQMEFKGLKEEELTIKERMIHPAAPGKKAYQKFKWCNLTPSMNRIGKLAAALMQIEFENSQISIRYANGLSR